MACWAAFAALPFINLAPFPDPTNPYRYFPPGEQSQEYDVFTPTVGAQWHINADVMLYVSFSKGFKAGGWTTRLSNPVADIDEAAFGPEESETYELGFKSQFFDQSRADQRGGVLHRLHRHPAADPGRRFARVAERG